MDLLNTSRKMSNSKKKMNYEVIKRLEIDCVVNWYAEYLEKASHMVNNY